MHLLFVIYSNLKYFETYPRAPWNTESVIQIQNGAAVQVQTDLQAEVKI